MSWRKGFAQAMPLPVTQSIMLARKELVGRDGLEPPTFSV